MNPQLENATTVGQINDRVFGSVLRDLRSRYEREIAELKEEIKKAKESEAGFLDEVIAWREEAVEHLSFILVGDFRLR
jgi:hypothetical protein